MPAWSPEVANDFIRLAAADRRALDQIQLQKLVYIAHGICLATYGQPLTGDRPEAWEFGPVYRRIRDALAKNGAKPVRHEIRNGDFYSNLPPHLAMQPATSKLDAVERDIIDLVYQDYGSFAGSALSALTRRGPTPWREVYADGAGEFREIPHRLIRAQFVHLARRPSDH